MSAMMIGALALLLLIILIFLHVPVAVAMAVVGLAATCLLTGNIQGGLSLFADSAVESLSYSGFMIIPLFILMGGFAGISGLSRDLFRLSAAWLGWAKGGVGLATIGTCAGFGAICGSSVATTAPMVNMALPELQKRHYNDVLSSGVIVGGSTLGSIIPPSMIMVIYAIQAEQSVRDLFVAALLPGLVAVLFCLIAVRTYVSMNPASAPETEHSDFGEKIRATIAWGVIAKGELDQALIKASQDFNRGLIRAHVGAVGDILPAEKVRAVLATRLNMVLTGSPGLQPAYVQTYVDMLNKNVLPVVPSKGSIGQADITILGHTALAMIGEGTSPTRANACPRAKPSSRQASKPSNPTAKTRSPSSPPTPTASASPPCKAKNWRSSTACSTSSMPSRSKA